MNPDWIEHFVIGFGLVVPFWLGYRIGSGIYRKWIMRLFSIEVLKRLEGQSISGRLLRYRVSEIAGLEFGIVEFYCCMASMELYDNVVHTKNEKGDHLYSYNVTAAKVEEMNQETTQSGDRC